jgi:iron complex transport system ATP-binding protein
LLRADSVTFVHGQASARRADLSRTEGAHPPGVHAATFDIDRGESVGLLGPNGSGKTTLLRLLAGTLTPASGGVSLDGTALAAMSRKHVARRIAVVPQDTHLAFDFSVLEVALMGRYPHLGPFELEGPGDLAIVRNALEATGTAGLERRRFSTLSGGEKQRVMIASALAQEAEILLLDEPTASLDLGYQIEISSLLERLNRERDLTLVVATHDLNLAAGLCRRLVLLRGGRIIAQGSTADVLTTDRIESLYGVTAEVQFHPSAGRLTVVPLHRVSGATSVQ